MLDLQSKLMTRRGIHRPHTVVGQGEEGDLVLLYGRDRDEDSSYVFITPDGLLASLGIGGIVKTVEELIDGDQRRPLLHRQTGYGNFTLPEGTQPIEVVIDDLYSRIRGLKIPNPNIEDTMKIWTAQRVFARFSANRQFYSEQDIIPEFDDSMIVVKVSDKCPRACHYCTEPGKFVLYDEDQIRANMELAKRVQLEFHESAVPDMNEGFLNGSDLLWHRLKRGGVDPIKIVEMFKEYFPNAVKRSAFVGVPTTNKVHAQDPTYLRRLCDQTRGLNRVLVGIETGHETTSYFLGKNETFAEKKRALEDLYSAGFKVKIIVQIGMIGQGYWSEEERRYISSEETLDETGRLIGEVSRLARRDRPLQVLLSRYVPIPRTKLAKMHRDNYPIIPYSGEESAQSDAEYLKETLRGYRRLSNIEIEDKYEVALEGRQVDLEGRQVTYDEKRFKLAAK